MHSNTEVFNFNFVDRVKEREKVEEFIKSNNNFLWIDGVHGVGKSFFIENYIVPLMKTKYEHVIYINKSSNEKNINYLTLFVNKLSEVFSTPLEIYMRSNYTSLFQKLVEALSDLGVIKKGVGLFANMLLNLHKSYLDNNGETHSLSKVLFKYIEKIVFGSSAYIILDNFSYCDFESFYVIEEMLIRLTEIKNLRFLICTTTEEREKNEALNVLLSEKLPHTYIPIQKLDDLIYFQKILVNKFHMTKWLSTAVKDIYNLCEGIPNNLKDFIRQLYIGDGISYENGKFIIDSDKATVLIRAKSTNFDPEKLQSDQRMVVQILALFSVPMPYTFLENFIVYITQEQDPDSIMFKTIHDRLTEVVKSLLDSQIVITSYYDNVEKLTFKHDNIFNTLSDYYREKKSAAPVAYMHHLLYLYTKKHKNELGKYNFYETDILEVLSLQSYSASEDDWQIYNEELAFHYYREGKFYRCNEILSRFRNTSKNIKNSLSLLMAKVFYEIAEYQACVQTLDNLNFEKLTVLEKSDFLLLYGKAVSFVDSTSAVKCFERALQLDLPFERRCQLEYYCEMAYSEIKDKLGDARNIFYNFYNNETYKSCSVYSSLLRSAVNIFSVEESIVYLNEGLEVSRKNKDLLEEGKIINNLGFLHTRKEDYDKAKEYFIKSCAKLENIKPFEMSYPLSNIVFIHMVKKEWEDALDYIENALIYNKAEFIKYVLKAYKMICFLHIKKIDEAIEIQAQLLEDIESGRIVDYKMIKKCKLNCAYVAYKIGDVETRDNLLQECWNLVKDSFAQNRYLNLCKKMDFEPSIDNITEYRSTIDLYDEIDFEPWVVTFGHD